jgi:hypothetical protein
MVVAIDRLFVFYEFHYNRLRWIHLFLNLASGLPLDCSFWIFGLAKMYFRIGEIRVSDWRIGGIRISDWRIGEIQKYYVTGLLNFRLAKIAVFWDGKLTPKEGLDVVLGLKVDSQKR